MENFPIIKLYRTTYSDLITQCSAFEASYLGKRITIYFAQDWEKSLPPKWQIDANVANPYNADVFDSLLDALDAALHILTGKHPNPKGLTTGVATNTAYSSRERISA